MVTQATRVGRALEHNAAQALTGGVGEAGEIVRLIGRHSKDAPNLLGFVLDMTYDEAKIVTTDALKRKCGGVPKNSFVLIRMSDKGQQLVPGQQPRPSLILARITEAVPTPLSSEVQQTIFAIHKIQADLDPFTSIDLQWGALRATILGTYYDGNPREDGTCPILFGNDIDSYISPHFYEVYVPTSEDLTLLINPFVPAESGITIGHLRYTETQTTPVRLNVPIRVSPKDFIGNRTAMFGKTRTGKSNAIKVIADMVIRSGVHVGQVLFDLNGEYAQPNEWDNTSLYTLHRDTCVRYRLPRVSLGDNPPADGPVADRPDEAGDGAEPPRPLKVNFYEQVPLGHAIIRSLWGTIHHARPAYVTPLLDSWEPCDGDQIAARFPDRGERIRYERALSMYFALLAKAEFPVDRPRQRVTLRLSKPIRQALALEAVGKFAELEGAAAPRDLFEMIPDELPNGAGVDEPESLVDDEEADGGIRRLGPGGVSWR